MSAQRYPHARFKTVRVHVVPRIKTARRCYCVPHALMGQGLNACIAAALVELLHSDERATVHARSATWGDATVEAYTKR